jgi:hypothetical protein
MSLSGARFHAGFPRAQTGKSGQKKMRDILF